MARRPAATAAATRTTSRKGARSTSAVAAAASARAKGANPAADLLKDAIDPKAVHVSFGDRHDFVAAHEARQADLAKHNEEMMDAAVGIRKETVATMNKIEKELHEAETELLDAAATAEKGHATIQEINERLKAIEELNTSARHHIVVIVRNMCKDKCMTILIIAVLVGVSIVGALLVRQTLIDSRQSGTTTVVVQSTPPPGATPAPPG